MKSRLEKGKFKLTLFLSALVGRISKIKKPAFLAQALIYLYKRIFHIDLSESKKRNFESLYELFTRELKRSPKLLEKDAAQPVDGELVSFGKVKNGMLFLIKGKEYPLEELLGSGAEDFKGYYFYNYYLSPKDYHRVHFPVSGIYDSCSLIGGSLFPVAPFFVERLPDVFCKNKRTLSVIQSLDYGKVGLLMVGALNVGSLEMNYGFFEGGNVPVKVGEQIGLFGLGSSVVLFTSQELDVEKGKVLYGEKLSFKEAGI